MTGSDDEREAEEAAEAVAEGQKAVDPRPDRRALVRYSRARRMRTAHVAAAEAERLEAAGASGGGRARAIIVQDDDGDWPGELLWWLGPAEQAEVRGRARTAEDRVALDEAGARRAEARVAIEELAAELVPGMTVLAVEVSLAGEHARVWFEAPDAALWRPLAEAWRERTGGTIALEQVGSRVKASLCGGVGVCGRSLCCSTVLRSMPPVPMKLARSRARSLAPVDTAGACGRLKCCLRYELDEPEDRTPKRGDQVTARRHSGEVVAVDPLSGTLLVEDARGRRRELFVREVKVGG